MLEVVNTKKGRIAVDFSEAAIAERAAERTVAAKHKTHHKKIEFTTITDGKERKLHKLEEEIE